MFRGQAQQDRFVTTIMKQKQNGFFVEIGSNHPIDINNSYLLEKTYNWKGIMIEYESKYLPSYKQHRPNSIHVIQDATTIDYKNLFEANDVPVQMDYLQIDLEVDNGSTIQTLETLNNEVLDTYTFATVTFEHDIYRGDFYNTRMRSRQILEERGYVCVFKDIHNKEPRYVYEDWYVHPSLVDMDYVNALMSKNAVHYESNPITGQPSIDWQKIDYLK
jgi:hypothetical protein